MDLFYFFFHLALNLSKNYGFCSFITTNYYLTATYADKLRLDLKNRASIYELINFNEFKIFESALGQHNIISSFIKNENSNKKERCNVINVNIKGLLNNNFINLINNKNSNCTHKYYCQKDLYKTNQNYILISENTNQFDISNSETLILHKIEKQNEPLGKICNIACGIQTGADKVTDKHILKYPDLKINTGDGIFVLNSQEQKMVSKTENEKNMLKSWFKNSDIKKWYTNVNTAEKVIYYTSKKTYNNIENIKKYLSKYKLILINRNVRVGSVSIKDYDNFVNNKKDISYVMIASAMKRGDYYCVSYARNEMMFNIPKIVCPQRSLINTFGYNECEWYASADVYYITEPKKEYKLKYILSLLNSKLYYIWLYNKGKRKGESLELYQKPLSEIPIKKADDNIQNKFVEIVDKILSITKQNDYLENIDDQNKVKEYEKQIDIMVYKLYELTYEEVLIIDKDFKLSKEEYNSFKL